VVQDRNAYGPARRDELLGDGTILSAGRRISRRMVVNEDDSGGALYDGGSEHLPGVNQGRVEDAAGHENGPEDPMLGIQEKGVEFLLPEVPQ
jgi:hypothetical protein